MINSGATTNTPTAEVVGPNWAVNTVPAFATQVQRAVGGQLINGQPVTQSAAPAPAPSPTATVLRYSGTSNWNSPPFTITGNNYSGNQDSNFIADMVADDPGRPSVNRQHHRHLRRHYNDALSNPVRGVAISSGDYGYRELDNQDHDVTSPGPGHAFSLCCTVVRVQSKCQVDRLARALPVPVTVTFARRPTHLARCRQVATQLVPRGIGDVTAVTACGRAGAAVRGSRRVHRAFVRRTRAKLPPPQRRDPGNPRPPAATAGHPAASTLPRLLALAPVAGPGRQVWRSEALQVPMPPRLTPRTSVQGARRPLMSITLRAPRTRPDLRRRHARGHPGPPGTHKHLTTAAH